MSDQVAIKTWGNSQGIRIPKNILEKTWTPCLRYFTN